MNSSPAKLIIDSSELSADLRYATKFQVGDPVIFLLEGKHSTMLLSDLEIGRGKREASVSELMSLSEFNREHEGALGKKPTLGDTAAAFLKSRKIRHALVPPTFPLALANHLSAAGIKLEPVEGHLFPERQQKTAEELKLMRRALQITEAGLARGIEIISSSDIGKARRLIWGGKPLTSERLRAEIDSTILHHGGLPMNTIVAGGDQGCDPHERGHGPLKANEMIILDVFPRDARSGFFGDLTRTVLRGNASDAQRKLYATVQRGQKMGIDQLKTGASGEKILDGVRQFFTDQGYPTERNAEGRWTGFFHGLGHGLGLDIHEIPRMQAGKLKTGQVFTVEPGLYYPGIGGVRIEDVCVVTPKGGRILSKMEKRLEV
jgi:Xaa-Pro aminopeptidase